MEVNSVAFVGLITIIILSNIYIFNSIVLEKVASDMKAMSLSTANNRGYCVITTNRIQRDNVGFAKKSFSKTCSIKK